MLLQEKNERIDNFEIVVRQKTILIFYITKHKTDRKPDYQYDFSFIDVEINPKRRIPSSTRFMDAYDEDDFKERLTKLFTKAQKKGDLPEQVKKTPPPFQGKILWALEHG